MSLDSVSSPLWTGCELSQAANGWAQPDAES
jgi:hypothetical protein